MHRVLEVRRPLGLVLPGVLVVVRVSPFHLKVPTRVVRPDGNQHLTGSWSHNTAWPELVTWDLNTTLLHVPFDSLLRGMEQEERTDDVVFTPHGVEVSMRVQYADGAWTYFFCRRRMEEFISQVLAAVGEQWGLPAGEAVG